MVQHIFQDQTAQLLISMQNDGDISQFNYSQNL